MYLIIFLYAIWQSVFAIGKKTLLYTSPLFLTTTRMIIAGSLLLGYLVIKAIIKKNVKSFFKLSKKEFLAIFIVAVFSMYLTNILEFWGLERLSTAKTCFIYSLTPFFAAILSYIHFKEKMNLRKLIGLIIGFAAMLPVMYIHTGTESSIGGIFIFSWAEISLVGAVFFSTYGWILMRMLVKDGKISPLLINGLGMLIAGIIAFVHCYLLEKSIFPVQTANISNFIKGTLLIIFISNILCYNLYGYLLKRYTATFLSFVGLLSPIFTSITGFFVLNEKPSPIIILSTFLVMIGVWIVYKQEIKQGYIKKKIIKAEN